MHRFFRVILVFIVFILSGCGPDDLPATPTFVLPKTPITPLEGDTLPWSVATVTKGDLSAIIESQGELVPKEERSLYFTASGLLKDVFVNPGDLVNAGEVIAELDTRSLEEQVLIRESELTIANLEVLRLESQLPASGIGNEETALNYTLEIAKERVKLAEARFQHSQQQLASSILKAPFSGSVSGFVIQPGENVRAYETIGQIADTSEISVQVMVSSTAVDIATRGTPADIWVAEHMYSGMVTSIDPNVTLWQGESAHRVSISFDTGQALSMDINNTVDVRIRGETQESVLMVPLEAVDYFPGQAYVDIVEGSNLHRVPVEVGISDGINVEIRSGLEEGDIIALP